MIPPPDPVPDHRPDAPLRFRGGLAGALLPIAVFVAGAAWLGFSGAPDERGLWPVLLAAIGAGLVLARGASDYSAAVIRGMSRPIVMLMVAAWLLAGVFSVLLRESGLVHALVWAGGEMGVRGGGFVLLAFLVAVLFSTATGTSLGTILICAPLLYPAAGVLEAHPTLLIGAILAGATFGDNVSPVSDTTIASASSQRAPMGGVVRSRLRYAVPAAAIAAIVLVVFGGADAPAGTLAANPAGQPGALATQPGTLAGSPAALPMLLAPLATFLMLWRGRGLVESLFAGAATAAGVALLFDLIEPADLIHIDTEAFRAQGLILDGMEGAVGIVVFTILLMGIVGAAREAGVLDRLVREPGATTAEAPRRAELRIFGVTSAAVIVTTHSVMAILAVGDLVRKAGRRAGIGRFRRANLLDMTVCTYPFLFPFFIPTILASSATGSGAAFGVPRVTALGAGLANPYSWALLAVIITAIVTGWGRSEQPARNPGT